jgi:hypothetical protein
MITWAVAFLVVPMIAKSGEMMWVQMAMGQNEAFQSTSFARSTP